MVASSRPWIRRVTAPARRTYPAIRATNPWSGEVYGCIEAPGRRSCTRRGELRFRPKTTKRGTRRLAETDDGGVVNINIVLPSSNASESKALYDKVRELTADTDASDEDVLSTLLSGLFNIVAKLESQSQDDG